MTSSSVPASAAPSRLATGVGGRIRAARSTRWAIVRAGAVDQRLETDHPVDSGPGTPMPVSAEPLSGGVANDGRVFRVGNTVHRPLAPSAPAAHALLRHLRAAGLVEVPRVLGTEGGAEVLSWIPGEAGRSPLPCWAQDDELLISVAQLLRRFHDSVQGFDLSSHRWPRERVPAAYRGNFLSHNDVHTGNVICAGSTAVGLIDFDLAGPGSAVWDLAAALRCWSPLCSDADMPPALLDRRADRMRLLLEAYGAPSRMRQEVVEALIPNHDWTYGIVRRHARAGHAGFRRYWEAVGGRAGRSRRWLEDNTSLISRAAV